jgi:hypothetical protein
MGINQELATVLRYPRRAYVEFKGKIRRKIWGGNAGEPILEQDWDNLIILDGCRYDTFQKYNEMDGSLSEFVSQGTDTGSYMQENFAGVEANDVVYVSANPNPAEVDAEFAAVREVWDTGWDDDLHTVPPEVMVEETLAAEEEHPNKRIISHFLQPHYPWIGPKGQEMMTEHGYRPGTKDDNVYLLMRRGEVSTDRFKEAYEENLEVTLPHVERLVDSLNGKTVISSDHGEAFGKMDVYGHASYVYIPELEVVPWFEVPFDERKIIKSVDQGVEMEVTDGTIEKLRDLGYQA